MGGPLTLSEVAALVDGSVEGDGSRSVSGVQSLDAAGPSDLSFLSNRRYTPQARRSRAGAVLVGHGIELEGVDRIVVADPYRAFAQIMQHWHPVLVPDPEVHTAAWVAPDAVVDGVRVEAFAWVGPGARVGPGSWLQAGSVVGAGAVVGSDCRLMPHAVVMDGCSLGDRVWLNPGAVVGAEGFGFAPGPEGHLKIPQVGGVSVGDDVEIGANSCVDRAALDTTRVRAGAKLDNLVQVGHAADIGEHSLMVAFSGVAGSTRLGKGVVLAAKAAVLGHISVGDGARVGVASAVTSTVEPGDEVTGIPAIKHARWRRAVTAFADLDQLTKTIRKLEKRIAQLEESR